MVELTTVELIINGRRVQKSVEPRMLLSDFIRHELDLTGTHVGCEQGVCGACTILFDGQPVRSCIMLAIQVNGHEIKTVEGLAAPKTANGQELHPLQEAFWEAHGLQCGFCTPGFLMTLVSYLERNPDPTEMEIREALSGNLCRCTGYQNIIKAAELAARNISGGNG